MLIDLFPRAHARFLKLPLLGDYLDGLAQWFRPGPEQQRP